MEDFRNPDFIERVFHRHKSVKNEYLNSEDLKLAMLFLFGYKPSNTEIAQIMKTTENTNRYGNLSLIEFKRIMTARMQQESYAQDIRNLFQAFDIRCQGYLTLGDVIRSFKHVAPHLSEQTIRECFNSAASHDGKMSFREFETVMKVDMPLLK